MLAKHADEAGAWLHGVKVFRYSDETAEAVASGEKLLKESGTIYESFADMMSPEDAKRYLDFLENGSREGLTSAELADALLVSQKVGYEDVWDLRNVGDALESGRKTISLPEYDGTTTHGVLVLDDGTQIGFTSGNGDPRYTNYRNNGHVEQKSALYMRENNISNATVYHNNTNGTCGYCNTMTATFLPEGATLTVVPPENAVANNSRAIDYVKTYTGTSNDPKISPRYKGN